MRSRATQGRNFCLLLVLCPLIGFLYYSVESVFFVGGVPSAKPLAEFIALNPVFLALLVAVGVMPLTRAKKQNFATFLLYAFKCLCITWIVYAIGIILSGIIGGAKDYFAIETVKIVIASSIFVTLTSGALSYFLMRVNCHKALIILIPTILSLAFSVVDFVLMLEIQNFVNLLLPYSALKLLINEKQGALPLISCIIMLLISISLFVVIPCVKKDTTKSQSKY